MLRSGTVDANTNDVTQDEALLHGGEVVAFDGASRRGARERAAPTLKNWRADQAFLMCCRVAGQNLGRSET